MKIQPLSALVGAASLGVVLLTVSAFQVPAGKSPAQHLFSTLGLSVDGEVGIKGMPSVDDYVTLTRKIEPWSTGAPLIAFTVPSDKRLVLTYVSANNPLFWVEQQISGVATPVTYNMTLGEHSYPSPAPVFAPGSDVVIASEPGGSVALGYTLIGYLADL